MKTINDYKINFKSNELKDQVKEFLTYYGKEETVVHSFEVAEEAKKLAKKFSESSEKAFIAGLFHDISVVIPNEERVELQEYLNEEVLEEERIATYDSSSKTISFYRKRAIWNQG
ncbi:HD domain-containing protein [Vagococcus fluvialis]|uniref:HD domain-containing protein n=1 Tax=Vagococcus fluvialis TaxID=2738 RepID=UPI001F5C7D8E|nr:HD domain-containing protein [Vagococcus fluvialis]